MHGLAALALETLVVSGTFAAPTSDHGIDRPMAHIVRRDEKWEGDSNGNLHIYMSDNVRNFGSVGIADLIRPFRDSCSPISCNGETHKEESKVVDSKYYNLFTREVEAKADGTFSSDKDGARRWQLIEAAIKAMDEVAEIKDEKHHENAVCSVPSLCEGTADNAGKKNREYHYPDEIHLRYDGDTLGYLDLSFDVDAKDEPGFCEAISDVGSAVSGAVGKGIPFALIDLACLGSDN